MALSQPEWNVSYPHERLNFMKGQIYLNQDFSMIFCLYKGNYQAVYKRRIV